MYKDLFEFVLSFLLDMHLEVEYLDHMLILFNFLRNCEVWAVVCCVH